MIHSRSGHYAIFVFFCVALLWVLPARSQVDCVGPAVDKESFVFNPPLWGKLAPDLWENPEHSAQIRMTTHPIKEDLTIAKYAEEFPKNLKRDEVLILKKKQIKIGERDAFLMEGKQKTGKEFSRLESISVFGDSTLYYFTLIANNNAYTRAKSCFDAVVQTLKQKK